MKNKFKVTALIATMLILTVSVANAQNRRPQNRMSYQGQCLDIPGLSDDQKTKITSVNDAHQVKIDGMRASFYEEVDITKANEIKANMILEQNNHLKEILKVLDADQTNYFNENIINGSNSRGRFFAGPGRAGRGQGFGQANRSGRGGRAAVRAPRGGRGGNGRW